MLSPVGTWLGDLSLDRSAVPETTKGSEDSIMLKSSVLVPPKKFWVVRKLSQSICLFGAEENHFG